MTVEQAKSLLRSNVDESNLDKNNKKSKELRKTKPGLYLRTLISKGSFNLKDSDFYTVVVMN